MRSGTRIPLARTISLAVISAGLTLLAVPTAQAQNTAAGYRRLPHRPRLTVHARQESDTERKSATAGPAETRSPIRQAGYVVSSSQDEVIVGEAYQDTVTSTSPEGVPIESLWDDSYEGPVELGGEACCDGGPVCWPGFSLNHLSFFGGVHGSKNPSTRGRDASFGFHEGLNFGTAARNIILPPSVGLQIGFEAQQANIEGASFTSNDRKQYFLTTGIFNRRDCGLQGGIAFDYLWDNWNYDLEASQIRGELSYALSSRNSFGFLFASSTQDDDVIAIVDGVATAESWSTVDYYTLFYRTGLFGGGRGEAELMAGFTGDSGGIVGGKSRLPLVNGFALETEFTYLVPDQTLGTTLNAVESWNLGVSFVWYPGSLNCSQGFGHHRPMFDVANNGSMILRQNP